MTRGRGEKRPSCSSQMAHCKRKIKYPVCQFLCNVCDNLFWLNLLQKLAKNWKWIFLPIYIYKTEELSFGTALWRALGFISTNYENLKEVAKYLIKTPIKNPQAETKYLQTVHYMYLITVYKESTNCDEVPQILQNTCQLLKI